MLNRRADTYCLESTIALDYRWIESNAICGFAKKYVQNNYESDFGFMKSIGLRGIDKNTGRRRFKKFVDDLCCKGTYIARMFRILWANDKKFLLLILLDVALSSVLPFATMFLVKNSINMLTGGEEYFTYFYKIAILVTLIFIGSLFQTIISTKSGVYGNMIGDKLFRNIFNKTMEIDFEYLQDKKVLEKRELAMQVIEQGRFNNLIGNFRQLTSNFIILAGVVCILAKIDYWIVLLVFGIVLLNSLSTSNRKKAERIIYVESVPINRKIEYFWTINKESTYGKEIRIYNMRNSLCEIHKELTEKIQAYVKKVFGLQKKGTIISLVTSLLLDFSVYLYLGYKILVKSIITIGDFSLYLNAITTFNKAVQAIVSSYIDISNNGQYLKDYFDYIEMNCKSNSEGIKLADVIADNNEFVFENVSFTYPYQDRPALKNINLKIRNREKISIVGENGAGKSTLVKLLLRLYEPTRGRILLNGTDIKDINYYEYLSLFSTVFQDFKIFAFKILDNVTALNRNGYEKDRVDLALTKAGLKAKVDTLRDGVDTFVNKIYEEEGVMLSGGEEQKLAIARALYKDAPFVILDEPTAALDPKSEYDIYTKFFSMVNNKTSLFISHRLSSTKFCDRIIVLKNGEIVEAGSHSELLLQNRYYAELFKLQAQFYVDE